MRAPVEIVRSVFVLTMMWAAFHAFGYLVLVYGHSASPLIAVMFFDGLVVVVALLWWISGLLFKDRS